MTLQDVVRAEQSDEETFGSDDNVTPGSYVLVKFATKKKLLHYAAFVENVEANEFAVSYLRRKGQHFVFPVVPEQYNVPREDIVMKLPPPTYHGGTARAAQKLLFSIDFQKFNTK